MASDIWWRTILIVRKETRCRHKGYSYRLTARIILYAPSHRQDNTYHSLCYTSREALAGARNSSMGTQEPMHVWTDGLIKQSSISLNPKQMYSRSLVWRKFQNWCCDAFVLFFLWVFVILFFCLKTLLYLMDCFNTVCVQSCVCVISILCTMLRCACFVLIILCTKLCLCYIDLVYNVKLRLFCTDLVYKVRPVLHWSCVQC